MTFHMRFRKSIERRSQPANKPENWTRKRPCELRNPCGSLYHTSQGEQGYQGRTGIYELITVDDKMRTLIHDGAGEQALESHARERGPSIRDDGLNKVLDGETTLEEVLRVTRGD